MDQANKATSDELRAALGEFGPIEDTAERLRYEQDWSGDHRGYARIVLRPRSTAEVQAIVRRCMAAGLPVVPQGGHTGLVGGGTPTEAGNEVVVSLERMNRIRQVDPLGFSMVAEAGCILESVQGAAAAEDLYFPLSLSAQGSCQIGGNIATNAGGINVLRYGMTRDLVLGLEVVLPDGRLFDGLSGLRKDNTGYDLKQLFIGAEGTLGIVTAASLKLYPRPSQVQTALLGLPSVEHAVALFSRARRDMGDLLSAFELMPRRCVELALEVMPGLREPFDPVPTYILLEASTGGLIDLRPILERFLEGAMEQEHIIDGAIAANTTQARDFWRIREGLIEGQVRRGRHLRTDVSIPISAIAAFIASAEQALRAHEPDCLPLSYGHIGDGNIHLNVLPPLGLPAGQLPDFLHACEEIILTEVDRLGGSISAEHGIGIKKRAAFLARKPQVHLELMKRIKDALDPAGWMSPGRVLE
ncbi:MAG TPA: FAD-binding oxidoreductase [Geminicoccus sp.]|jgi:FAD/FMN-containing dehydrogenase|uniref:FAD-binding oxidoreductase n=1 Tax=Geminicoccus sp. TaxID=2024832 RepID=UPI002E358550|nr:FAD-binding oxidoreductase [Geminicoccus sp.]HEX2528153.1 FAD-binding oxidoreductase [Geminicoccus sp.]